MDEGFETVEIVRKDQPDVIFEGKLIADASSRDTTRQANRNKDRWTDLAVFELANGDWVACTLACSDKPDEQDFGEIALIERKPYDAKDMRHDPEMRREAMKFWNFTWLAKQLAAEAGWDVRERIG